MSKTLRKGCSGPEVRALQHALNARPYIQLAEDGIFGPLTESAVRAFQRRVRLSDDGIVGPRTDALMWCRAVFADAALQVPVKQPPTNPPSPATISPTTTRNANVVSAPAAPASSSGAGIVHQVSLGGQVALTPWLVRPTPPPGSPAGPIWSGSVSYALVYRTASEGPHIELALNPQFLVNSRVQSTDPRWTLQLNGQVTFADLVAPGRWHLVSPYLQAGPALNLDPNASFGAAFAIGKQVSFDLVPDRLQINLQTSVGAQWSNIGRPDAAFSVVGAGALGATVQF